METNTYADVAIDSLLTIAEATVTSLRTHDDQLRAHDADRVPLGVVDLLEALVAKTRPLLVADTLDPAILQRPPIALVLHGSATQDAVAATVEAVAQLQLEGYVVLEHFDDPHWDEEDRDMMGALLRHKIDMADVVNIANGDGIDEALLPFIEYAENTSTPVLYSENDR